MPDPIVRVTEGEIRKRIGRTIHEEDAAGEILIDLRPALLRAGSSIRLLLLANRDSHGPLHTLPAASELRPRPIEVRTTPLYQRSRPRSLWRRTHLP